MFPRHDDDDDSVMALKAYLVVFIRGPACSANAQAATETERGRGGVSQTDVEARVWPINNYYGELVQVIGWMG